jgi:hypothetical protein
MALKAGDYLLRAGFWLKQGQNNFRGPVVVSLTEKEASANAHKIEPVPDGFEEGEPPAAPQKRGRR